MHQSMHDVEQFLEHKRVAMVGMSRDEKHISRHLLKAFVEREYEVLPVNPQADSIAGVQSYPTLAAIDPAPEAVMVLLSGQKAEDAVNEAIDAGAKAIWVYGIRGEKDVAPEVLERLKGSGAGFVAGFCPFMFLEGAEWGHRAHAWIWKVLGMMPKKTEKVTA